MLPASEGWERLHPLSPLVRAGRAAVIVVLGLAQAREGLPAWIIPAVALPASVAVAAYSWWVWRSTGYRLVGDVLELRTGALFRAHRRVPLARIESVDIARPLLARVFGLAEVRVEAVSEGGSEVRLSFLPESVAADVRQQLTTRAGAIVDEVESQPQPEPTPAVRVSDRELALAYLVGPLGALVLFATVSLVPLAFGGVDALMGGVVASALGFLGAGTTLVMRAERLYGFSLAEVPEGLRLRRGLLNELHQTVPLARVQAVRIEEPALWRPFHRSRLVVDVAGYRGGDRESRRDTAVLLPVATPALVAAVLQRVMPGVDVDAADLAPPPESARWRSPLRWRRYGVRWTATHAVSRSGLFRRQTDVVPHAKVQSLRVTQGPWQRALDLATVHADTAGVTIAMRARHRGRAEAERLAWQSRAGTAA
jgi:putative membrane protein